MIYVYVCPLCKKRWRSDSPNEPCCTGPSENRDDHEMTVMHLLKIGKVEIHPAVAARKAISPLILLPDDGP